MRHLVVLLSLVAFADPSAWAQTKKILLNNPDPALLKELQSVFRAQVWPGDTLIAHLKEVSAHEVHVETINQSGVAVLHTEATVH